MIELKNVSKSYSTCLLYTSSIRHIGKLRWFRRLDGSRIPGRISERTGLRRRVSYGYRCGERYRLPGMAGHKRSGSQSVSGTAAAISRAAVPLIKAAVSLIRSSGHFLKHLLYFPVNPSYSLLIHLKHGTIVSKQAVDLILHIADLGIYLSLIHIFLKTRKKLNEILAANTGQPLEVIERDTERDNYMDAQEAKAYGLIDDVFVRR